MNACGSGTASRSAIFSSASTTAGLKCVPEQRRPRRARRRATSRARYGRSVVIALNASQHETIVASSGISSPASAVGVAAAVPALVRGAHDEADVAQQAADAVEHQLALDGVHLHDRPLVLVELAGLVDDLVRDGDLADVVQQRAELDQAARAIVDAHLRGDRGRQRHDVAAVHAGVLVVLLEHVAEQQRRALVGLAELERVLDAHLALAGEEASRPASGRRRAPAHASPGAASTASSPIGASRTSTSHTQAKRSSCSLGGTPSGSALAQRRRA